MKRVNIVSDKLKKSILKFLYEDELFNIFMIHSIENETEDYGEIYITEENEKISEILHLKYDGNSYFTTFYASTENGLEHIANQLSCLNYERILLSGQRQDVFKITKLLGLKKDVSKDIFYTMDLEAYKSMSNQNKSELRKAEGNEEDIEKIKKFKVQFFGASNEEEIREITNTNIILEDIKNGVFFIEIDDKTIGMARFSSKTINYFDITTVYIDKQYRGKGYGTKLIEGMVEIALGENKTPLLQTEENNIVARKVYEALGFKKHGEYSFEFIS